ncbi:MAG: hypothetical protein IT454_15845 [Planctomycetes bacterium]|nr:hypothetical protein [Planctomycetota bacterium]
MRVLVTAGFDAALHAVALAELARRAGHTVAGVLVVRALQAARVRAWVRQRGARSLFDAAKRLAGSRNVDARDAAMEEFLRERSIAERSLSQWCRVHDVALCTVEDLNSESACSFARAARVERVLYAGGGILRERFLAAVEARVLNAHAGPLPEVRGMNACEWSLLLGCEPTVTIHWIDSGIDTGATVERIAIALEARDDLESLRGKCTVAGVRGLVRALDDLAPPLPTRDGAKSSRQCFTMAPALRELAQAALRVRGSAESASG